jgi:hypothetical protein
LSIALETNVRKRVQIEVLLHAFGGRDGLLRRLKENAEIARKEMWFRANHLCELGLCGGYIYRVFIDKYRKVRKVVALRSIINFSCRNLLFDNSISITGNAPKKGCNVARNSKKGRGSSATPTFPLNFPTCRSDIENSVFIYRKLSKNGSKIVR